MALGWWCLVAAVTTSGTIFLQGEPVQGTFFRYRPASTSRHAWSLGTCRGGASATAEPTLDEKVQAAMKKLGISKDTSTTNTNSSVGSEGDCKDGVCRVPSNITEAATTTSASPEDPYELADRFASEMQIPSSLAMAAIGATMTTSVDTGKPQINQEAALETLQYELDLIATISSDSPNVQALVQEGYDEFLSRRALALTGNVMEDAKAVLIADQLDEQEEQQALRKDKADTFQIQETQQQKPAVKEVNIDFDPSALASPGPSPKASAQEVPKPAAKEAVIFEATTAQIQKLVLESPVPVLLDVYADWCGPCKVLGPALEEMAIKAGGMFRLVKVNSDNERPISAALQVAALPTVFGIREGKILHFFQGMPRDENAFKNFLMGLMGAAPFSPPVTADQTAQYQELTNSLIKTAGAAAFSFSARERLTDHVVEKLDALAKETIANVEETATLLRTLLNTIVKNPYESKFRRVNLENKRIASTIGASSNALAVLKSLGFVKNDKDEMILSSESKVLNVAPLVVARDCIDKWLHTNRREMAAMARKHKDEADRANLELPQEENDDDDEEEAERMKDPTACTLKLRLDGKKKIHEVVLNANDPLSSVLDALKVDSAEEEVQITCVSKRLVVKSSDKEAMIKSLKDYGLMPAATIVVKVGSASAVDSSKMKERAAQRKKKKGGSHTMQSVGIYSTEDNAKGNLVDGGGGVWYEQDVSSDDDDEEKREEAEASKDGDAEDAKAEDAGKGVGDADS
jgi:thioredoxin-like negative regulator of GroEL